GDALASLDADPDASLLHLDRLPEALRESRISRLLRARALSASGQAAAAETAFEELERDYPDDYLTQLIKAQEHASRGDFARASAVLTRWLRNHDSPDPNMLRQVAQYQRAAGETAQSQRWFGEYYAMVGDLPRASAHLREALSNSEPGSNQHARLRSRLEEINERLGKPAPEPSDAESQPED
ncbi:MAG: hypothetical protein AAF499_09325, partial [Pseudomonadota bacterium]